MNGEKRISSNAFKWMNSMLVQRAKLQRAVSDYIDANAALRKCEKGKYYKNELAARVLQSLSFKRCFTLSNTDYTVLLFHFVLTLIVV